jgi:hypothetical protein
MRNSKALMSPRLDQKLLKNFGYIDKKEIKTAQLLGIDNRSPYYNNLE